MSYGSEGAANARSQDTVNVGTVASQRLEIIVNRISTYTARIARVADSVIGRRPPESGNDKVSPVPDCTEQWLTSVEHALNALEHTIGRLDQLDGPR